ncbi:MAG: glycosyltransferase family 2 protein [Paludibacter sp.]|jgi:glycosyltransferase involved in cell wall biosynthesis|nr:glycosyltransferase family 2 protein [Paludibacter sp.]
MYSVLIPTFNYDITKLVRDLHRQATELMLDFEIIVLEDGSDKFVNENSTIGQIPGCRYIRLNENIGRSKARNKLAGLARYDYLIIMDCDAEVRHDDYLQRYANFFKDEKVVVIGGTEYDADVNDPRFSLRLKYGRKREANLLYHTRDESFNNFATFNFMLSRDVIQAVQFDESINGYGHEDTLFGHALHEAGISYFRIDNALVHKGLDDNLTFLKKTEESVDNLYKLFKTGSYPFLEKESHLLAAFSAVRTKKLVPLFAFLAKLINPILKVQLCSSNPSLRLYDAYKLLVLCRTAHRNLTA